MKEEKLSRQEAGRAPGDEEVRSQLERMLASPGFARSPRQSDLLRYLIAESLAGRAERIKATSIALDVFDRDENFDQQADPIVRVEAGRLRSRLARYYDTEGREDPVVITIPKGAYQPAIARSATATAVGTTAPVPDLEAAAMGGTMQHLRPILSMVAVIAVLAAVWLTLKGSGIDRQARNPATAITPMAEPARAKPFLMVMPLDVMPGEKEETRIAFGLVESLIADLAKLTGLSVMAHASILDLAGQEDRTAIDSLRRQYGVTHLVRGSLMRESDQVVVSAQLVDTSSGATLWAERLSHGGDSTYQLQEELALTIASQLSVQLQPGERARLADPHTENPEAWVLYRQGLVTLMPPNDVTRIQAARVLFQRAQQLDPAFAGGYAGESFSHSVTVLFLKADSPQEELGRAISLAERAIDVDPDFAMGYAVLSFAQAMAGNYEIAVSNARQATEIQPGDAFTRFIMGMNQIIAGEPGAAVEQLRDALRLDPFESRTPYMNVLAIAQYANGDYAQSLRTIVDNLGRDGPRGPHMAVFQAAALARLDRPEEASDIYLAARRAYPNFPVQGWLSHWLHPEEELRQTLALLGGLVN